MRAEQKSYERIKDDLLKRVHSGDFAGTGKLPGERALAESYCVSHLTMNKAVALLVHEGVLERRANSGTFIRNQTLRGNCILHIPTTGHVFHELSLALIRGLQKEGFTTTFTDVSVPLIEQAAPAEVYDLAILDVVDHGPLKLVEQFPAHHYAFFPRYSSSVSLPGLSVLIDYRAGGYEAARQFEAWRCRNLVMVSHSLAPHGPPWLLLQGMEQWAREGGNLSVTVDASPTGALSPQVRELLAQGKVDGLFGTSDAILVPVLKCMDELRISREAVKTIGYYNTPWSESYHFSSFDICGDELVSALLEQLRARCYDKKILIKPRFVQR